MIKEETKKCSLDYWHKIGKETNSHTPLMDFMYGGKENNPFHVPLNCEKRLKCKRGKLKHD